MKFTGELTVRAPRAEVYKAVRDARFFASCVDGVHDLQETAPDTYAAVFETKVAYMKFSFKVTVRGRARRGAARDRSQGRRHAAWHRRPPDRDVADDADRSRRRHQDRLRSRGRASPASSAASASRCCARRRRKWNGNSPQSSPPRLRRRRRWPKLSSCHVNRACACELPLPRGERVGVRGFGRLRKAEASEPPHPRSLRSLDLSPLGRGERGRQRQARP